MKTQLALNTDLSAALTDNVQAPEWVELIPAGPAVIGRDGRQWLFDEAAQQLVQSSFAARNIDLPIGWEHATQQRAPQGDEAPSGGWIKRLEVRDGALWGEVDWTPSASVQELNREYRFLRRITPSELQRPAGLGRFIAFVAAAPSWVTCQIRRALTERHRRLHRHGLPRLHRIGYI